ncbi:hypothetical protein BH20ACT5_BH20ACT5_06520 [soil metagenome]
MRSTLARPLSAAVAGLIALAPVAITPSAYADPVPQAAGWETTGSLAVARERAAAVLLGDGSVMMMGGRNCGSFGCVFPTRVERYDPTRGTWSFAGHLSTGRSALRAVVLGNGKVLAIGGLDTFDGSLGGASRNADLYDPATNTWSSGGTFDAPMDSGFQAVLLDSGKVLVLGNTLHRDTVIYNPGTNSWSDGPDQLTGGFAPTATLLPNGKVLVAGGLSNLGNVLAATELYDPASNTFSPGPAMFDTRWQAQAAPMPDGRVLIVGGLGPGGQCLGGSEVYNPASNTFGDHKAGLPPREEATATPILTNNGTMLVAGGNCSLHSAGLYHPGVDAWQTTPGPNDPRRLHPMVRLHSGLVLAAGGQDFSGNLASAELYTPRTSPTAYATPNPVRQGSALTVAGSGFLPGETVRLSYRGTAFATPVADAAGRFSVSLNTGAVAPRAYIDRAEGQRSGRVAWFSAPVVSR